MIPNPGAEQTDMVDDALHGFAPADIDDDLVADPVAILEVHAEAGEVVVDLVLTADRQAGTDESGAGQEERRVDAQEMERHDHGDHPDHQTGEMADHPGGSIHTLPAPLLADLSGLTVDPAGTDPPESGRRARATDRCQHAALRQPADHTADDDPNEPARDTRRGGDDEQDERHRQRAVGRPGEQFGDHAVSLPARRPILRSRDEHLTMWPVGRQAGRRPAGPRPVVTAGCPSWLSQLVVPAGCHGRLSPASGRRRAERPTRPRCRAVSRTPRARPAGRCRA